MARVPGRPRRLAIPVNQAAQQTSPAKTIVSSPTETPSGGPIGPAIQAVATAPHRNTTAYRSATPVTARSDVPPSTCPPWVAASIRHCRLPRPTRTAVTIATTTRTRPTPIPVTIIVEVPARDRPGSESRTSKTTNTIPAIAASRLAAMASRRAASRPGTLVRRSKANVHSAAVRAHIVVRNTAWYMPATLKWCGRGRVQLSLGESSRSHCTCVAMPREAPTRPAPTLTGSPCGVLGSRTMAKTSAPLMTGSARPSPHVALRK